MVLEPVRSLTKAVYVNRSASIQCLLGILMTLLVAAIGVAVHLNLATASLLYLLLVVSVAVHCGFFQASVVSLASILCQTYFFTSPTFSFRIADPRNAIAIVIFELTALLVSRLSARERAYSEELQRQRIKIQRLYAVSCGALTFDPAKGPEKEMAHLIRTEFQLESVAIYNAYSTTLGVAGSWQDFEEELLETLALGTLPENRLFQGSRSTVFRTPGELFGTLVVAGTIGPVALQSLASLTALILERQQAFLEKGAAEASRQTEQLRTTVLDGLAHAFKTPLTVIRAASSGLLESGKLDPAQSELMDMIDEQSIWLNDLTTRLLATARVGEEKLCLEFETIDISTLLNSIVAECQRLRSSNLTQTAPASTIHVHVPDHVSPIAADHDLLRTTLLELLENALKYTDKGKSISLSAAQCSEETRISVHSWSKVIDLQERDLIFDRFYRSLDHHDLAPGTGIGLSVAQRVAEAHKGQIWVTSSLEEGTTFNISLPRTSR
jgi:two-component system sensor histidine kinase KdpD